MRLIEIVAEYVSYKRSIGMCFDTDARILGAFCRHIGDVTLTSITTYQVRNYLDGTTPVSSYWQRKHTAIAGLFRFALNRGYVSVAPLPSLHPQCPPPLVPYIYSQAELKRLLNTTPAACGRQVPLDAYVFRALILLLYAACLRLGEALRLTMDDVDLDQAFLTVRETKFYKSRLVPLGQDLLIAMKQYVQKRNTTHSKESSEPFFCFINGRILSQSAVRSAFRRLRVQADVQRNDGARYQPRLHDLRHTGAVHRLVAWYRSDADLQLLLPQLATYLGHIDLASTQHYLTLTPELLREASMRFEHYYAGDTP
ncbi:MAG: tyrosine-type recombinase/integrase [Gammaproteobacteria bacterium]|nr:tyrosine-type recombinase/integrase [Gammaproteobacteria bacterium]